MNSRGRIGSLKEIRGSKVGFKNSDKQQPTDDTNISTTEFTCYSCSFASIRGINTLMPSTVTNNVSQFTFE